MLQLILKTFIRALLIFLPVAFLSFSKNPPIGQGAGITFDGLGGGALLISSLIIAIILFSKRKTTSFIDKIKKTSDFDTIVDQKHYH